eukprot:565671-Rhodomonas_salina.1
MKALVQTKIYTFKCLCRYPGTMPGRNSYDSYDSMRMTLWFAPCCLRFRSLLLPAFELAFSKTNLLPVSYTHLTLPTICSV